MEGAPTSTLGLIQKIKAGDREAFSPLFLKYRKRLSVLIHYKLGGGLAQFLSVRDILQETCLRAYRDFHRFSYDGPGSFMNWLSKIADHVLADQARYAHRDKRRLDARVRFRSVGNPDGPELVDTHIPSRKMEEQEGLADLVRDLDRLPEDYRRVLVLARIHGATVSEIARQTGRTPNAVSILLHRAVRRFRELRESATGSGDSD